jgi:hypothetical protein
MSLPVDILDARPHPIWDTRRLWSLWDMINFGLGSFLQGLSFLNHELGLAQLSDPDQTPNPAQHNNIKNNIEFVMRETCAKLLLEETSHTCVILEDMFRKYSWTPYTYRKLADTLTRLREDIKRGAGPECFYYYPREMAKLASPPAIESNWKSVLASFPSSRREIETGIDCYAMGDAPGCVFHMLRIAELGLRAMARDLGISTVRGNKPIEYAMWGEVIGAIRTAIDDLRTAKGNKKTMTVENRENREAAVAFYSAILGDMQALLALYRDRTMHFRDKYDNGQAFSAMTRVKEMMMVMAGRLTEANPCKINWGL